MMRREELLVSGGLVLLIAIGGAFHLTRKPEPAKPIVSHDEVRISSNVSQESSATKPWATIEGKEDINEATRKDLMRVQGVGEVIASGILSYREKHGPFRRMADLQQVPGVGEKRLESIQALFEVPGEDVLPAPAPEERGIVSPGAPERQALPQTFERINVNTASSSELESLPGVGPVIAGRIIDWRARNGPFLRVEELENVSGIGPAKMRQIAPLIRVGG